MKPLISVISVNYNGYALTCAMVESLRRHVTSPLEIIVVDNGSARDEAAMLRERYPEIKALRSERNLGFAGGNNLGFAAATGDYLLLLNNDTEVEDDTLHYLCETLAGNPAIGAVCPKIRFFAPPRHIQFAGYTPPDTRHVAQRAHRLRDARRRVVRHAARHALRPRRGDDGTARSTPKSRADARHLFPLLRRTRLVGAYP